MMMMISTSLEGLRLLVCGLERIAESITNDLGLRAFLLWWITQKLSNLYALVFGLLYTKIRKAFIAISKYISKLTFLLALLGLDYWSSTDEDESQFYDQGYCSMETTLMIKYLLFPVYSTERNLVWVWKLSISWLMTFQRGSSRDGEGCQRVHPWVEPGGVQWAGGGGHPLGLHPPGLGHGQGLLSNLWRHLSVLHHQSRPAVSNHRGRDHHQQPRPLLGRVPEPRPLRGGDRLRREGEQPSAGDHHCPPQLQDSVGRWVPVCIVIRKIVSNTQHSSEISSVSCRKDLSTSISDVSNNTLHHSPIYSL